MHDRLQQKGICSGSCALFKFLKISDNISLSVQDTDMVAIECLMEIGKLYVAYSMTPLPMPLNDLEGHFCCL